MFGSDQWLSNPASGFYNGVATQSLRFDIASTSYLKRTPSSASNRKTYTLSFWLKPSSDTLNSSFLVGRTGSGGTYTNLCFSASDNRIRVVDNQTSYPTLETSGKYRDVSAWYHIVFAIDTTQGTASNRVKIYVNGEEQSYASSNYYSQNADTNINSTDDQYIGYQAGVANLSGYLAEYNLIDGTQLTPQAFGETKNGVWIAKEYEGSYGTNGFRLQFNQTGTGTASASTIGADTSGNTNHFTSSGIVASDCAMPDSPENNFATMNPINKSTSMPYFSEGNLKLAPNAGNYNMAFSNMGVSSGKFYYEFGITGTTNTGDNHGIIDLAGIDYSNNNTTSVDDKGYAYYPNTGNKQASGVNASYGASYTNDDIISVALDMDAGKVWFAKNGTYQASGDPAGGTNEAFSGLSGTYFAGATLYAGGFSAVIFNFGQDSSFAGTETAQGNTDANGIGDFYYAPPSGFLALCTANLPEPTIGANSDTQADDHFGIDLYTGNDGTQTRTTNFKPDWLWIKSRAGDQIHSHFLVDSSRSDGTIYLKSDVTQAEATDTTIVSTLEPSGSTGFTLGSSGVTNDDGTTYVAWHWKANGGTTVSNTDGTITSTVQANTDAGFSIVTYTGTGATSSGVTIGHGLGKTPAMIITKKRNAVGTDFGWSTWHKDLGGNYGIWLNKTDARNASMWAGYSNINSTVFSPADLNYNNVNTATYINYCFADVEGYSKIGSYTGNSNNDGTFVWTGFRPAMVMVKRTTGADSWFIYDIKRNSHNVMDKYLLADTSGAEATDASPLGLDMVSNGFKWRINSGARNTTGETYIYMAFADSVGAFKYANAK
jgi:hypothetical protein